MSTSPKPVSFVHERNDKAKELFKKDFNELPIDQKIEVAEKVGNEEFFKKLGHHREGVIEEFDVRRGEGRGV